MPERLKRIARTLVQEVFNERNPDKLRAYLSPDYREHMSFLGSEPTMEGMVACLAGFFRAVPDLSCTLDAMVEEGDLLVMRGTMRGTHTGPVGSFPPTGRSIALEGVDMVRFEGDKLAEHWGYYDQIGLLTQLGLERLDQIGFLEA